ncbi:hypothetical protein CK203_008269 [Vitis vinifera]|uniref:Uncharacterized protein n=1 Tax=Vitis vinifera TaxID=29760 RepID=A0A438KP13_VITVI|nr:hypothetical protein CK203_008269 [Vitis vinifera]
MRTSLLEALCRKVRIKMLWQWRLHEQVFELNQTLLSIGSGFMVKSLNLLMQQLRAVTLSVARLQSVYWMRLISFELNSNKRSCLVLPSSDEYLEPPRQRPETSARTAGRLIAQAMGMKLPSTSFGSRELKKQEAARKQRIVARKILKDDAWGSDDGVNRDSFFPEGANP